MTTPPTRSAGQAAAPSKPHRPRPVDPKRDPVRGGEGPGRPVTVVIYGDFLCTFCRRLRRPLARLRETMGGRMRHVFRHFPNEDAHPGAELWKWFFEAGDSGGKQLEECLRGELGPEIIRLERGGEIDPSELAFQMKRLHFRRERVDEASDSTDVNQRHQDKNQAERHEDSGLQKIGKDDCPQAAKHGVEDDEYPGAEYRPCNRQAAGG